jgi:hypothetical protein
VGRLPSPFQARALLQPCGQPFFGPGLEAHVKYGIDYRYLAKGASTLADNTRQVDVEVDEKQFALIPNIGDFVDIPSEDEDIRNVPLRGRVRSRLFHYLLGYCYVTIVVEDFTDDWTKISPR